MGLKIKNIDITEKFTEEEEVSRFWNTYIDYRDKNIEIDYAPLAISENTPLAKVHFLFIMLGLRQIYVTRKGKFVGVIIRECFLKKQYS